MGAARSWLGRAAEVAKKRWFDEVAGMLLLALAGIAIVSLLDYSATDPTWFVRRPGGAPIENFLGRVGATLAEALLQVFGTAAFLVPLVLAATGWNRFLGRGAAVSYGRLLGSGVLLVALAALLDLLVGWIGYGGERFPAGGLFGRWTAGFLTGLLGRAGGIGAAGLLLAVTIVITTQFSFARAFEAVSSRGGRAFADRFERLRRWREARARERERRGVRIKHARAAADRAQSAVVPPEPPPPRAVPLAEGPAEKPVGAAPAFPARGARRSPRRGSPSLPCRSRPPRPGPPFLRSTS